MDFKVAFDNIIGSLLIYKLHEIGMSYKFVKMIENIYRRTKSAILIWENKTDYFDTVSGVKQDWLLSALLLALTHWLNGGVMVEDLNISCSQTLLLS